MKATANGGIVEFRKKTKQKKKQFAWLFNRLEISNKIGN